MSTLGELIAQHDDDEALAAALAARVPHDADLRDEICDPDALEALGLPNLVRFVGVTDRVVELIWGDAS